MPSTTSSPAATATATISPGSVARTSSGPACARASVSASANTRSRHDLTDTGTRRPHRSASGIEIEPVYRPADLEDFDPATALGEPGEYPYTRGIHPDGYRGRPWTMRQYAGFATAEETNARFRYLLAAGAPGLSTAFDLPTQLGMDSDDPLAAGEVGRVGVAIDSVAVPKPAYCRIVQRRLRYIVGWMPRVKGNSPGSPSSRAGSHVDGSGGTREESTI